MKANIKCFLIYLKMNYWRKTTISNLKNVLCDQKVFRLSCQLKRLILDVIDRKK